MKRSSDEVDQDDLSPEKKRQKEEDTEEEEEDNYPSLKEFWNEIVFNSDDDHLVPYSDVIARTSHQDFHLHKIVQLL